MTRRKFVTLLGGITHGRALNNSRGCMKPHVFLLLDQQRLGDVLDGAPDKLRGVIARSGRHHSGNELRVGGSVARTRTRGRSPARRAADG